MKALSHIPPLSIKWEQVRPEFLLFIFLPPIIGIPLAGYRVLQYSSCKTPTRYWIFMICIAIYFAAINATKEPGGDQIQYFFAYQNVPKIGFWKSLIYIYGIDYLVDPTKTQISGEFMNGLFNYVGYYITFGYYPLFAALITFANYMLVFMGLYKFCLSLKKPHIPIICGIIIISFFYLYFQYVLQIQKQFLAQSIMIYVLGSYAYLCKMTKKLWIITTISIFTHAATLLFVPFLILKPLHKRLTRKGLLLIGTAFIIFIVLGPKLAGNITNSESSSVLTYSINRLAQSEAQNDTETNALVTSQVIVIYIPLLLIVLRKLWLERKTLSNRNAFVLNVVLLLLLTVIGMFRQPLAQYRYFMMLLAFMPFVYPFITNDIKRRDAILKGISGIMIIWFYYQFETIIWSYAPEIDIIIKSPILLLFGNYYSI